MAAAPLALLAALVVLAPGQARAANECGTLTNGAATCSATSYANGIQYLGAGTASVTVPGAATAWTVMTGTGNNGSGIVLDSDNPGTSDTVARNLALTVGGASATANQVAITMRASPPANAGWNNHGIKVNQQGRGTSSTTVTTHAGVTIGTETTRMMRTGIHADVWLGTGAATITNAATIYSTGVGIYLQRGGAADTREATTITNSGAITAANMGLNLRYFAGDGTNDGDAKIENTGAIVKDASGWSGAIDLEYQGTGDAEVDNKGTVTATEDSAATPNPLTSGYGIRLRYLVNSEQLGDGAATIKNTHAVMSTHDVLRLVNNGVGAATIENSGALTATGTTGTRKGIWLHDLGTTTTATTTVATVTNSGAITANEGIIVFVQNKNTAGDDVGISITHSGGAIVASDGLGIKGTIGDNDDTATANAGDIEIAVTGGSVRSGSTILEAVHGQAGDIDITVSDGVTLTSDNQHGIFANLPEANTVGGVTIMNEGEITTAKTGIYVRRLAPTGAGAISVTNSGPIKKTGDPNWMAILVEDKGTGDVTVTNSGDIGETGTASKHEHGIRVDKQGGASGGVTVESSGDVVVAQRGILINVNEGLARIDVTGGSFNVGNTIVEAKNLGVGNVDVDIAEDVTLTSSEQHGVFVELGAANALGSIDVNNAGTITTPKTGIYVRRQAPNGAGNIAVTNRGHIKKTVVDGAINWHGILINDKGIGSVTVTNSGNVGEVDSRHGTGILAEKTGAAGDVTITSSGGTVMSGGRGIFALVKGPDDDTPTNTGIAKIAVTGGSVTAGGVAVEAKNFFEAGNIDIDVAEGVKLTSERDHGIFAEVTSDNKTGTVTIDQKGAITTPKTGIYVRRCEDDYGCKSNGAIRITNSGDIGKSSVSSWMGIFVAEKGIGPVTVTNSGDVSGVDAVADSVHDHGILVQGGHEGDDRAGAFTVTNSGDLTAALFGIWVPVKEADRRIAIKQSGAITARKGIHVQVGRDSTEDETRAAEDQPLIDIAWTGGAFSHGTETAEDDVNKLGAGSVAGALDVNLEYVTHETTLRGGPAVGIEAQVMTWHSVAAVVATGDDPGEIADAAAQMALLAPSGAASQRTAILRHFRAALATEVTIPNAVFGAIKAGATSVDDLTDAEIVAWLSKDDEDTRTLLRNVLAQSLSGAEAAVLEGEAAVLEGEAAVLEGEAAVLEGEAAVLRAVVTGDDAALDAALDDADAGFSDAYKTAVKALRERHNVGNIRVAMTGGSIDSRGDGIRAYYATPHANNGAIDVTVDEGASVTGGTAGIWVANAGLDMGADTDSTADDILKQSVTVHGTVTGGTDAAVHLVGGGKVTVGRTGEVLAGEGEGSSGVAIRVNDPGRSEIIIHGRVRGSVPSADNPARGAAVDMAGGGMLTVGAMGRVSAGAGQPAVRVHQVDPGGRSEIRIDGTVQGREGANAAVDMAGDGRVTVGQTGRVDANGAVNAIWRGDREAEVFVLARRVDDRGFPYRADVENRMTGHIIGRIAGTKQPVYAPVDVDGVTGMGTPAPLTNGTLDLTQLEECPVGQVRRGDGECRTPPPPPPECPAGQVRGDDGECRTPPPPECPAGQVRGDDGECRTPPPPECPAGQVRGDDGECRTPPPPECPAGQVRGDDGECRTPPPPECPAGQVRGDDGECRTPPPPPPTPKMYCDLASDERCRLYEALPSVLLAMNGLPTYEERMASARDARGGWARVETARGKWKADSSTRPNVAYDHRRTGVRAGADMAVGENGRLGVSVHGLRGSADMTQGGGKVELTGVGVGVNGTTMAGNGVYIDAQAAVTRYDVELTSSMGRILKDDAKGTGYMLAVEAGRSMALAGDLSVTPRAGLAWSRVSLKDFRDSRGTPVSMEDAGSLAGRVGVGVEKALDGDGMDGSRLFGSLDVVQEFKEETEVDVPGTPLKASAEKTRLRATVGSVHVWGEGRNTLQGSVGFSAGDGDNRDIGGGLSFSMRF